MQLTVQSTPLPAASFATVAATAAVVLTFIEEGGCWVILTEIGGRMVTVAEALFVISAIEVAVMVTLNPPAGADAGAV